eukprot:SAG11_NODE_1075_length_5967_cov_7.848841_4_plen_375_part_00
MAPMAPMGPMGPAQHEFLCEMERQENSLPSGQLPAEEPSYVFDQGWWVGEVVERIITDALPAFLQSFGGAALGAEAETAQEILVGSRSHAYFLSAGSAGAGVSFHQHNQGFNLLLSGQKRWFLYPATTLPKPSYPDSHVSILDWARELLPTLEPGSRPFEVVQQAGEVLYIPDGWFHATLCLENTVAVASQLQDTAVSPWTADSHRALRVAQNGKGSVRSQLLNWQKYARAVPTSEVAQYYWARSARQLKDFSSCVKGGTAAQGLGGDSHAPTSLLLGECFTNLAASSKLDKAGATAAVRLMFEKAQAAFLQSATLNPLQLVAWERLLGFVQEDCDGKSNCPPNPLASYLDQVGFNRQTEVRVRLGPHWCIDRH